MEVPYYNIDELAQLFGITTASLQNSMSQERFPVPTYKLGKYRVADKKVVQAYFDKHQKEGLDAVAQKKFFARHNAR